MTGYKENGQWANLTPNYATCDGPMARVWCKAVRDFIEEPSRTCGESAVIGWLENGKLGRCYCAEHAPKESQNLAD